MDLEADSVVAKIQVHLFGRVVFSQWRATVAHRALDLRSTGRGFKSYSGQSCATTLGKLFTPMCLFHQAV